MALADFRCVPTVDVSGSVENGFLSPCIKSRISALPYGAIVGMNGSAWRLSPISIWLDRTRNRDRTVTADTHNNEFTR